ncbi:MAG TPA: glycine cleavage system protein H [Gemmataceae bacterium]|jgi:glycine cleavage system H protein|nr:glycine cleavage system protein H [Gemmataceae bacterium]
MADELVFEMGKFPAVLPTDRLYCRNHMWCLPREGRLRFGFTSYAVRLMQDVYFLDWSVDEGTAVVLLQTIGHIETSKATSDLFAPMAGTIRTFNQALLADPSGINISNYSDGWLFEMEGNAVGALSPEEYHQFLAANWEKTQATIKGHL